MSLDIEEIVKYNGSDRVVHFTEYLLDKSGNKAIKQFHCGYPLFDSSIGGLESGEVVVVSGYTKNGKTLFAESWINSMAVTDPSAKAAIFSFEVQTEKLLLKYMSGPEDLPIYVPMELKTMDFDWLLSKCAEAKYKYNCRIILIDHLHFLVDMNTRQNMSLNIGAFMRRLKKDIALDLNLSVILIAHQGQPKEKQEASLSNIRDSSFVGQESDATIIVSRRENFDCIELEDYTKAYQEKHGKNPDFVQPKDGEDRFSANLAIVKVSCHRRTGVYDWKKLFRKNGHIMEQL